MERPVGNTPRKRGAKSIEKENWVVPKKIGEGWGGLL